MTAPSPQTTVFNPAVPKLQFYGQGQSLSFDLHQTQHILGRATDADITLPQDWSAVSRYHATLRRDGDGYQIFDGVEQNGENKASTNGLLYKQRRVGIYRPHPLQDGDELQIGQDPNNLVRLVYRSGNRSDATDATDFTGAKSWKLEMGRSLVIGRDPANADLHLDAPVVSRRHAVIEATPQGYILHDRSTNGVFISRQESAGRTPPLRKAATREPLKDNDILRLGPFALLLRGDRLFLEGRGEGLRVDAKDLHYRVLTRPETIGEWWQACTGQFGSKTLTLIDNISLPLEPGQLVALVGGSGAGKSTLLKTLLGIIDIRENNQGSQGSGNIYLNEQNIRQSFNQYRTQIGYVPQQDIVHKTLSVDMVLRFAAQLRLPLDTQEHEIDARLTKIIKTVSLTDRRLNRVNELSGGQLKRVSIAAELLADPKLFFLDEPTSGLDPGLDKRIMELLQNLAQEQNRTVALVTHATQNIMLCDRVAFLGRGGNLCYFGPPDRVLAFFNEFTRSQRPDAAELTEFADVYIELDKSAEDNNEISPKEYCQRCAAFFRQHPDYETFVEKALMVSEDNAPIQGVNSGTQRRDIPPSSLATAAAQKKPALFPQISVLVQRETQLLLADRVKLVLSLLTAPVAIALIRFAVGDNSPIATPATQDASLAPQALRVLFVFTCAALWVGLLGWVQAIVREAEIYAREHLVNLQLAAYLGSKVLMVAGLAVLQTLLVMLVVLLAFASPDAKLIPWWMGASVTTFLTLLSSGCLGLMVSSVVKNENQATAALPLLLLPQIIFAGVLFDVTGLMRPLSWLMLSRWSVGAYASLVNVNAMTPGSSPVFEPSDAYAADWSNLGLNWLLLLAHALVYVAIAVWQQAQKSKI